MMSEKLKTIKELADELGVSKSYVDKIIRILKLHTKLDKVGNKYVISKKQEKSIITRIENSKSTTETHTESTTQSHTKVDAEVDFLKEEIAYLKSNHDKQLTNKDKQIETLSNLLDQQQRLALQDKKLLEEYKAEINDLKALISLTPLSCKALKIFLSKVCAINYLTSKTETIFFLWFLFLFVSPVFVLLVQLVFDLRL